MNDTPSLYRYPPRALVGDYVRSACGLILTAGPLFLGDILLSVRIVLIVVAFLFFAFGLRTLIRQAVTVEMRDRGILVRGPLGRGIEWRDLDDMRLSFFSTRRDRETGWMQLRLSAGKTRIRLDGALDGFREITAAAAGAAGERKLALNAATVENLIAIGIDPPPTPEAVPN